MASKKQLHACTSQSALLRAPGAFSPLRERTTTRDPDNAELCGRETAGGRAGREGAGSEPRSAQVHGPRGGGRPQPAGRALPASSPVGDLGRGPPGHVVSALLARVKSRR